MIRVVYSSAARPGVDRAMLDSILEKARTFNAAHGLTGLLLFRDGIFLQLLEGHEFDVRQLYEKICMDSRHTRVTKLIDEPITERDFSTWSMGFHIITDDDLATIDTQRNVSKRPVLSMAALCVNPPFATKILLRFSQPMGFVSESQTF